MALNDLTIIKQHSPFAQYQLVNVVFNATAHTDTDIRHTLQPETPEHIGYMVVGQAQAGTIYHDLTSSRKAWRKGVITLRSSVASARATLLLFVTHERPDLLEKAPADVTGVVLAHEHAAEDITSGTLPDGRFPATLPAVSGANLTNLDASDLASGTVPDGRFPATLPAISGANLTNLDASDLASGTIPDGRFPATLPAASGANLTSIPETAITDGSLLARLAADESVTGKWNFPNRPRCVAYHSTTQSIPNNSQTICELDSEDVDVGTMHDLVTNNSRLTIPSGEGGLYLVSGSVDYAANATGTRRCELFKNGTRFYRTQVDASSSEVVTVSATALVVLAEGDYIELGAFQDSGGALNTGNATAAAANRLFVVRLW